MARWQEPIKNLYGYLADIPDKKKSVAVYQITAGQYFGAKCGEQLSPGLHLPSAEQIKAWWPNLQKGNAVEIKLGPTQEKYMFLGFNDGYLTGKKGPNSIVAGWSKNYLVVAVFEGAVPSGITGVDKLVKYYKNSNY